VSSTTTHGETPNSPATLDFMTRDAVLRFFGGNRPLHVSTLYRGMNSGIYPKPVHVAGNAVRWIRAECEAAAQRMLDARNEPKPPTRRGRKRRRIDP
jgi:predicted DNA-binding transcriptional regulator AlpA